MLDYNDLNDDEKNALKQALNMQEIPIYYLEENNILLMETKEIFEYIYMYDIKKIKDAINLIESIINLQITAEDINKTIIQKLLENRNNVYKLSNEHYAYKEN